MDVYLILFGSRKWTGGITVVCFIPI